MPTWTQVKQLQGPQQAISTWQPVPGASWQSKWVNNDHPIIISSNADIAITPNFGSAKLTFPINTFSYVSHSFPRYLVVWSGGNDVPLYYMTHDYKDAKKQFYEWEECHSPDSEITDPSFIQLLDLTPKVSLGPGGPSVLMET